MENETVKPTRPNPYRVDALVHKIQTLDEDGERKYLFRHDFSRLDASNIGLLLDREKDTKRFTEKMTKGRSRARFRPEDADKNFYRALCVGGGWRPAGLVSLEDESLILPSNKKYYAFDEVEKVWNPSWIELDVQTMHNLTPEKMGEAIDRWLLCKGKNLGGDEGNIDFMFEKGGIIRIGLSIGDFDSPAYKLLFHMRRPDTKRRTKFKEDFAYAIDHTKGDLGKVETVIDLRQGIGFFDEYFATCPDDQDFSEILFTDKRDFSEQDREPQPVSAVPVPGEEEVVNVRPYTEEMRDQMVAFLNPHFKVEVAAATVQAFSRTDQE